MNVVKMKTVKTTITEKYKSLQKVEEGKTATKKRCWEIAYHS